MVDYSKVGPKSVSKLREDFFNKKKVHFFSEKQKRLSSKLESDKELQTYSKFIRTFKPDVKAKHPGTFSFYANAEQTYFDAFYNIINFYPFDGTREEIMSWHIDSFVLDSALLRQYWPGSVGHLLFSSSEYIKFYAGPQSIPEQEFIGKYIHGESALKLDASKGNTVEFWLKKDSFTSPAVQETIFHVGSHPGKVAASDEAEFKVYITSSGGMPFHVTYKSSLVGVTDLQLSTDSMTASDVADSVWHHYSIQVKQTGTELKIKLYVDGSLHSTTTQDIGQTLESSDVYMAGTIGCELSETTGTLAAALDEFRFWKGSRSPEKISKFFDKKIYASNIEEEEYEDRLGVKFSFNKENIGVDSKDSLVLDLSGNDVTGRIKNYVSSCRKTTSAIDESNTTNTEPKDPILDEQNNKLTTLFDELKEIGKSFDRNNNNSLKKYLPEWTREFQTGLSNDREFNLLLQMMAVEFDTIKMSVDSIRKLSTPAYSEAFHSRDLDSLEEPNIRIYSECGTEDIFLGCADSGIDYELVYGNEVDFAQRSFENIGLNATEFPLLYLATPEEEVESVVSSITLEKSIQETRNLIYKCLYNTYTYVSKRKGTYNSYRSILNTLAAGGEVISTNIYGTDAELYISEDKVDNKILELRSINFSDNPTACIYLYSSEDIERTYLEQSAQENDFTFEGSFSFPLRKGDAYEIADASIFGIHGVSAINNDLTVSAPDRASIQVSIIKQSLTSNSAKFVLSSDAGIFSSTETPYMRNVYGEEGIWNIAVRIIRENGNNFISDAADVSYKVILTGKHFIGTESVSSFEISQLLSQSQYQEFSQANKTVFIGAHRENITATLIKGTDIKVLDFNAWKVALTDRQLKYRARNLDIVNFYDENEFKNSSNTEQFTRNMIFRMSPIAINSVNSDNTISIADATYSGNQAISKYGSLVGSRYNFKTTQFSESLGNVVQSEFMGVPQNIPIHNLHGQDGISIKDGDFNKFDVDSKPNLRILSFEKSMYRVISDEMIKFLGGVSFYNNAIGEPVNKYRKSYKTLDRLRSLFFESVENENQFERYVDYYRWIDKAVGQFLVQLVPASMLSNTGIENVIESHALERNKYDHKLVKINTKDLDLSAQLLSINELLYDWEHGHAPLDQTVGDDVNCLWQRDRKVKDSSREQLRKVLTTVVTGSSAAGNHFTGYVPRNLARPYVHSADKQLDLQIGSNRKANKIDIFYKIINEGKQITLDKDEIYIFRECDDETKPPKNKKYTAKIDTSGTSGYLDGDADLLLPFSLFSSSAGADFSNFKDNLVITNNHDDIPSLQGHWVRDHVGGLPHRRVKLAQYEADESGFQKDRPEAYSITTTNELMTIGSPVGQKSIFNRDSAGARFYNVSNIKTIKDDTQVLVYGNYERDYEIVQTSGRNINNSYLVDSQGVNLTGTFSPSEYILGITNYYVPPRPRREHIFVTQFSPLGSPEQAEWSGRDRVSGEFSVFNTVNYRNTLVREVYHDLSVEKSEKFGYRSGSAIQASMHKTNRNYLRFTGSLGKEFNSDNYYVTHHLPQNDFGYAWISASADEDVYSFLNKNANFGHQHTLNISGALKSSETIAFLAKGQYPAISGISGGDEVYWLSNPVNPYGVGDASYVSESVSFVNLNSIIVEPIDTTNNLLGFSSITLASAESTQTLSTIASNAPILNSSRFKVEEFGSGNFLDAGWRTTGLLNSIILNRQGPYGWPTWKQIRGSEHPIIRKSRKENIFSITRRGGVPHVRHYQQDPGELVNQYASPRTATPYKEIMVTNRFKPVNYSIHMVASDNFDLNGALNELELLDGRDTQLRYLKAWNYDNFFDSVGIKIDGSSIRREELPTFSQRYTIANQITMFANRKFQADGNWIEKSFRQNKNLKYLNLMVSRAELEADVPYVLKEMNYVEKIYPREENTFTANARTRAKFNFFGWNSQRDERRLILGGALQYSDFYSAPGRTDKMFPKITATTDEKEFVKLYYNSIESIDQNHTGSTVDSALFKHITASAWVLDAREDYDSYPLDLTSSFFNDGVSFLANRDQGTRGEGILQNDFSIYGLGMNALYGTPPFAPVYNRRVPQAYGSQQLLAGEARWDAGQNHSIGPFYNSYEDFAEEIRLVGQQYSIIPEFRMSRYVEDVSNKYNFDGISPVTTFENTEDFLELTGAVYNVSSGIYEIGSQFFKTYSTSDFLKYFSELSDNIGENEYDLTPFRISFRCKAVKRFLPYRGFYPAERAVQLSEIFSRCYNNEDSYTVVFNEDSDSLGTVDELTKTIKNKLQSSCAQASKLFFGPGVLFNSIKAGIAVDYPIFGSSVGTFNNDIIRYDVANSGESISDFSALNTSVGSALIGTSINASEDMGIPRISGSISRRIDFSNFLDPASIYTGLAVTDPVIYDNEPHPSASLFYGSVAHLMNVDRPARYGAINYDNANRYNGAIFSRAKERFTKAMQPYSSAAQNFAANTVDFFLEGGKLQTLMSDPVVPYMQQNTTYKMRVYLKNNNIKMYDRHSAFGPAVDDGNPVFTRYVSGGVETPASAAGATVFFIPSDGATYTDLMNNTLTLENYAGLSKTYIFTSGTVSAAAAEAVLDFTSYATAADVADETVTLTDYNDVQKTYIFKEDVASTPGTSAVAATGQLKVNSIVLDDVIFSLEDNDSPSSTTKTYRFESSAPAAASNGYADFSVQDPGVSKGLGAESYYANTATNYPFLKVTDKSGTIHTLRIYDSNSTYMISTPAASGVSYINLYNTTGATYRTTSEFITACKSALVANLDVSVTEVSSGVMRIELGSTGAFGTAAIAADNCFYDDGDSPCGSGNVIITDSSLPSFGGASAGVPDSGDVDGSDVVININGLTTISSILTEMETVIEGASGHNGTILVTVNSGASRLDLVQADTGASGNNTITVTGTYASNLTPAGFNSGADATSGTPGVNYTTGDLLGTDIVVDVTSMSYNGDIAAELVSAITSTNGHNGSIVQQGTYDSGNNLLTIKQSVDGTSGNGKVNSSTLSSFVTNFSGGIDAGSLSTGDLDASSRVVIPIGDSPSVGTIVSRFRTAIASSNGHGTTIITISRALSSWMTLTLIQAQGGISGNTSITGTGTYFGKPPTNTNPLFTDFMRGADAVTGGDGQLLKEEQFTVNGSHGHLPYVPPFLDADTAPYAEITYVHDQSDGPVTIPELLSKVTITYHNNIEQTNESESTNLINAMAISASVDLTSHATLLQDNVTYVRLPEPDPNTKSIYREERNPDNDKPRWIIQTKWETPVLDFKNAAASTINLDSGLVEQVTGSPWQTRFQSDYYRLRDTGATQYLTSSTGMWHQPGAQLGDTDGYYLEVAGPEFSLNSNVQDLASLMGFTKSRISNFGRAMQHANPADFSRKLGQIAEEKEVCEAVVIIPFYQLKETDSASGITSDDIRLIELNEDLYREAIDINRFADVRHEQLLNTYTDEEARKQLIESHLQFIDNPRSPDGKLNIAYQLRMMDKFILPPHFDFIRNRTIRPHLQYFFQFKAKIKKEELSQIWQNLYPDTNKGIFRAQHSNVLLTKDHRDSNRITIDTEFLSSYLDIEPVFQALEADQRAGISSAVANPLEILKNGVRWMVFKVKYRGKSSYDDFKLSSIGPRNSILQYNNTPVSGRSNKMKETSNNALQYNWPYDYFSLVEMAEIEAKIDLYSKIDALPPPSSRSTVQIDSLGAGSLTRTLGNSPSLPASALQSTLSSGILREVEVSLTDRFSAFDQAAARPATTLLPQNVAQATATASSSTADEKVNQILKEINEKPSADNVYRVQLDGGYSIEDGSEIVQVNGMNQTPGSGKDYTLVGNVLTFQYDIEINDRVTITYNRTKE